MPDEKTTSHPPPSPDLPSPTNPRDTHASSIFPYSTARPPTNYSDQSWVPPKPAPPVPPRHPSRALSNENPFGGIEEDEEELEDSRDTPLYARSDWEDEERTATGTAWSRSSYAGMTTGAPKSAFAGLDEIVEEDDEIFEEAQIMPPAVVPPQEQGLAPRQPPSAGSSMRKRFTGYTDRSTLPSVLDLEHLTATAPAVDPFADPKNTNRARRRTLYLPEPTPDPKAFRASPDLLTPAAHQRLGRMSVAPARYTLPAARKDSDTSVPVPKSQSPVLTAPFSGWSKVRRLFQAYRPFVNAELTLISAILLIMSRQNGSGLSNVVAVAAGAFSVDAANGAEVGLGAVGWCERGKSKQVGLTSTSAILMKGQSDMQSVLTRPTLTTLSNLTMALICFTWLLAAFQLVTAFLHFYLFFALSVPYSHLFDAKATKPNEGRRGGAHDPDLVQAEVDLRVRCERPPFEGYQWVWWAWWAHRRSPLGPVYALVVGILAIVSFGMSLAFESQVKGAVSKSGVTLGVVAFILLLTIFLTLDSMMSAVKYLLFSPARSFNLFLNPPDPTPAALLLPPSEKPMNHVRPKSGDSFFAPPRTTIRPDTVAPPAALLPGADLDPETRRWLAAYPADPDLVPLIAGLRQGKENDDFILSDVGLLYLRPEDDEPALLVPPAGSIRHELLTDAHLQSETGSGHAGAGEMLDQLGEVFWWMKMEVDVRAFCEGCVGCKAKVRELGPGMTSLPFTGVTGWAEMGEGKTAGPGESAMAAEMAFAMRRAEEEAERDALG